MRTPALPHHPRNNLWRYGFGGTVRSSASPERRALTGLAGRDGLRAGASTAAFAFSSTPPVAGELSPDVKKGRSGQSMAGVP